MPTTQTNDDFLDQAVNPRERYVEPVAPSYPQNPDTQLYLRIRAAWEDWSSRTYVQNARWTETNEARRAKMVETLGSLMTWWEDKEFFSPKQREFAKTLVDNAQR